MAERVALVEEAPVRLDVNGVRAGVWSCTPERWHELAAGWLLSHGYLRRRDEILALDVEPSGDGAWIRARVPPDRALEAEAERRHRWQEGCGLAHYVSCAPAALAADRATAPPVPPADVLAELFRALYAGAGRYRETGGLHVAALGDPSGLGSVVEEVGRHNAVDKAIGGALLAGSDLARLGLVLSARISAEIALKAARARLAWVASRSVPTTLAAAIAGAAGLPLVARAVGKGATVFLPSGAARPIGAEAAG